MYVEASNDAPNQSFMCSVYENQKSKSACPKSASPYPIAAVTAIWPMRLNHPVAQPQPGLPSFEAQ